MELFCFRCTFNQWLRLVKVLGEVVNVLSRVANATISLAVYFTRGSRADQILQLLILIVSPNESVISGGWLRLVLNGIQAEAATKQRLVLSGHQVIIFGVEPL